MSPEMSIESLPPRQREVFALILQLTDDHGYPPTLAELAKSLGLKNRMTVHQHVAALKKKGFVHWEPGLNRSLRVLSAEGSASILHQHGNVEILHKPAGIPLSG